MVASTKDCPQGRAPSRESRARHPTERVFRPNRSTAQAKRLSHLHSNTSELRFMSCSPQEKALVPIYLGRRVAIPWSGQIM